MKILIDIKDNRAEFFMELLQNLSFVKAELINEKKETKGEFLNDLKEAVNQINLAKQGKIKLKSAQKLLDEL